MFIKLEDFKNCYEAKQKFGKDTYYLYCTVEDNRAWFAISSGNKRRYRDIFEEKEYKSGAGILGLIWIRDTMLTFPTQFPRLGISKLCVGAADSRRWRIYKSRLNKYGFYQEIYRGDRVLVKKI